MFVLVVKSAQKSSTESMDNKISIWNRRGDFKVKYNNKHKSSWVYVETKKSSFTRSHKIVIGNREIDSKENFSIGWSEKE